MVKIVNNGISDNHLQSFIRLLFLIFFLMVGGGMSLIQPTSSKLVKTTEIQQYKVF